MKFYYLQDGKMVENEEGEFSPFPVVVRQINNGCLHLTFSMDWGDRWWGFVKKNDVGKERSSFTARQYNNYHPVAGGSGRHNATRRWNRMKKR